MHKLKKLKQSNGKTKKILMRSYIVKIFLTFWKLLKSS